MAADAIIQKVLRFMKKKLDFWSINFFLTLVTSFLLNGGVFAGSTEVLSQSQGRLGTIKLSSKIPATHVKDKSSMVPHQYRKHLGRAIEPEPSRKGKDDQAVKKKDYPSGSIVPDSLVGSFTIKSECCGSPRIPLGG